MSTSRRPKLVVLDRDGTINRDSDEFIKNVSEWEPLPGSIEAIASLCQAGWTVVVASNQSGLGRGLFSIVDLHDIHATLQNQVEALGGHIAGFYYCPHTPDEQCRCRKPRPGLLEDISHRFNVDLRNVPIIGDSFRDLQAASAIGARPVLVLTGNGEKTLQEHFADKPTEVYDNLADAAAALIAEQ
ncbi:MAG: D-glycero-beta-D-manno-heptose 1,7-bisphosphate 7-phosphatase [Gammaproteobacteria bacterium]|nr:D-glycero-beta-D-manno-heptose 1,7-bisphosphate 7-phosphatase [Gammaproteobacteria bacterium]